MRALRLIAAAAVVAALSAVPAHAEVAVFSMGATSFSPARQDVLVNDSVIWRNTSVRTHDIRSEAAGFDSGRLVSGAAFSHTFATPGVFPFVCTIHPGMTGELAVHPLLLEGPRRAVVRGAPVALQVRAPEGTDAVTIEEDAGAGFRPVATARPAAGGGREGHGGAGTLHATLVPPGSATYRAVGAGGVSPPLRVEVADAARLVLARSGRRGRAVLRVRSVPAQPGARVVLQLHLRERFGWWPTARARLDRHGRARFVLRRHGGAPARVLMVGDDWTTVLAKSRTVKRGR